MNEKGRSLFSRITIPGLVCLILVIVGPAVFDMYMLNTMIKAFFFAIAAITVDILWGYTGCLTFGQSAFFGLGAYAAGLVFTHLGFSPAYVALALALAVAGSALVGLFTGWISFYRGASSFFACIISLVLPIVLNQLILSGGSFTGSSSGLTGFDTFEFEMEQWYWIAGGLMMVCGFLASVFLSSDAGRILVSIRDNESRCAYLGLNPSAIKICLLGVCAAMAGLAGFGYGAFSGVVAPELTGFSFGTEMIIWVALSGRGTFWGPMLGTLVITVATAYLSSAMPFVWQLLLGLSFVLVIIFLPQGLIPLLSRPFAGRRSFVPALESREVEALERHADEPVLEMTHVERRYGSLSVLKDVTFTGRPGELIGIIGPNGAGKTTLMRCMSDGKERTGGTIKLCGHDIVRQHPQACVRFGLGRKFQNANIFESLTVAECLRMARSVLERPSLFHRDKVIHLPPYALEVVRVTGLESKLGTVARDLSHGEQQDLELAMVLALEPRIILLDEPTAGLTRAERISIGQVFSSLAHKYGLCCLLVEHDLDFVKEIATRIVVLHQGTIVVQGSAEEVVNSELVQTIYAGPSRKDEEVA